MKTITNFSQLEEMVLRGPRQTIAVAAAHGEEILLAVDHARKKGIADAHLVGDQETISAVCQREGIDLDAYEITDVKNLKEAAETAVSLVRGGRAQLLMKGLVETSDFLRAIMDREKGLRGKERICGLALVECRAVDRLLLLGDVGANISPNIEEKASILRSCFKVAEAMGLKEAKAAVLCASEHVKETMPCTLDARRLSEMAASGTAGFGSGLVEGPVSMDIAVSQHAAQIKKYEGQISGDADILLAPDLEAGNILVKGLMYLTGNVRVAGVGMGASVPLIQTSRGDDHETKYYSIVLANLVSQYMQR